MREKKKKKTCNLHSPLYVYPYLSTTGSQLPPQTILKHYSPTKICIVYRNILYIFRRKDNRNSNLQLRPFPHVGHQLLSLDKASIPWAATFLYAMHIDGKVETYHLRHILWDLFRGRILLLYLLQVSCLCELRERGFSCRENVTKEILIWNGVMVSSLTKRAVHTQPCRLPRLIFTISLFSLPILERT